LKIRLRNGTGSPEITFLVPYFNSHACLQQLSVNRAAHFGWILLQLGGDYFPEILNGGSESTPFGLVILVSWRKSRHFTFEHLEPGLGFNHQIEAYGWIDI
jgi:hypothetical protein